MSVSPGAVTGRRLWTQLLIIGWSAGWRTAGGRLRFVALLVAAASLTMVALCLVAAVAVYDGRDARERLRGPVLADKRHPATVLWRESGDAIGTTPHWVVYAVPLTGTAKPPPGLSHWPEPGEVLLSPELARVGADEGIKTRYGRFAGFIGRDGLASPAERLAFVRPAQPPDRRERENWLEVSGFGRAYGIGEAVTVRPLSLVLLAMGTLAGLPAVALAVIAARVGSAPRDRRNALLQVLGAGSRHRALVDVGEAAVPVLLGALLGTLPMAAAMIWSVRIPLTAYLIDAADLRAAWPRMAVTVAGALAVMLGMVVALHRAPGRGDRTVPQTLGERVPRWRLTGFGVSVAAVVASQYSRGQSGLVLFVLGTAGLWAFTPSLAGAFCRRFGGLVARLGGRGMAGALVGGRWSVAHPGVVVRLVAAAVIGIGLVVQLQVWSSRLGELAATAAVTRDRIGDSVLVVEKPGMSRERIDDFARRLPAGSAVLEIRNTENPQQGLISTLSGPCPALHDLGLGCPDDPVPVPSGVLDPRAQEIERWYQPRVRHAVPADAAREPDALLVVIADPVADHQSRVKQAAHAVWHGPIVGNLGSGWLIGADDYVRIGRWLLVFGTAGLALVLLGAGVSALAEFLRFGRALAPLTVLTGRARIFLSVAFWHLTVPMTLSVLLGAAIIAWDGLFFIAMVEDGRLSWTVMGALTGGAIAGAAVIGLVGGLAARRTALGWHPGGD